jgi:hypothetical protein
VNECTFLVGLCVIVVDITPILIRSIESMGFIGHGGLLNFGI